MFEVTSQKCQCRQMQVDEFEIKKQKKTIPATEYIRESFVEIETIMSKHPTAYNSVALSTQGTLLKMVSIKLIRILAHLVLHNTTTENYVEVARELVYMLEHFQVFSEREYNASLKLLIELTGR